VPHANIYPLCIKYVIFLCLLGLATPINSHADVTLSLTPIEEAKFLLKSDGWDQGASVHLTFDYDTTYLTTPEATIMGGTLHLDEIPGRLLLDIQNEEQSAGFEVCIFFHKQGDFPAVINFVTAESGDRHGTRQPLSVEMRENPNRAKTELPEAAENVTLNTSRKSE
jgi:hypothetical protein